MQNFDILTQHVGKVVTIHRKLRKGEDTHKFTGLLKSTTDGDVQGVRLVSGKGANRQDTYLAVGGGGVIVTHVVIHEPGGLKYDLLGQRLTGCCGSFSTYMDMDHGDHHGHEIHQALCCKACYRPVSLGEGDGCQFRDGVDPDDYYRKTFAAERAALEGAA